MNGSVKPDQLRNDFIEKMNKKECVIAVVGIGYVGLPLVLGYCDAGYSVLGVDVDQKKVESLEQGKSYITYIADEKIKQIKESGKFRATTDFSALSQADAILICVPTPLDHYREPDLSYIVSTTNSIAAHLREGQLVVLESTTYPGTTSEVLQPILEKVSGLKGGEDFFTAYSPEREDPANPKFDTTTISKVVGSATPQGLDMAASLYEELVVQVVRTSSPETAEAVKLTENIFRAVNIAMVNELKTIFTEMGIDIWEVIDAAATKPFGFMPFYPGPGIGGHCIPIDPFYLTWKAREYGHHTRFIELAGEINQNMPKLVINRLAEALSKKQKKALNGAKILVVGIAYKKDVDDMRESPSLSLMVLLEEQGAVIEYHDPFIAEVPMTREHSQFAGKKSVELNAETVSSFDAVLIATNHTSTDWDVLVENAKLIIDTRNALNDYPEEKLENVVKA